jgi:nucleoside-triphosphatase THEP1
MSKIQALNEKWIKAAIVGTIWAASEIVLGSFLHNLKVPFSGNVLTAIGLVILISVSYIWTDRGLFWRAGLICAIMKTMSPSAIIFGPMIAIFTESVLLETSVRLFGRTIGGYIIGGMLAMSWNLFQKILNFIIFYGFNIVEVYSNLLKFAQKQLNIHFDIVWLPIIVLLAIYCLFGLLSAMIGIKVGRKIIKHPPEYKSLVSANNIEGKQNPSKPEFNYSMIWLFIDILLIIGALVLLNYSSWIVWGTSITGIITLWAFRYKRALRQLSKPKFWIFFVIITMLTAFILSKVESNSNSIVQGLMIGLQMNFRAAIIIVGFSVLGTELYNPKIREFFVKSSFKQLPLALELSFESLPSTIANIPEFKTLIKNPVSVFYQFISQAEFRLAETKEKYSFIQKVFFLTGAIGQGKTTQVQKIIKVLKERNVSVGGIYAPKVTENNNTIGYDVVDIVSGKREIFLRKTEDSLFSKIGKYSIYSKGLQLGQSALSVRNNNNNLIIIIDEVGNLELEGEGWAGSIEDLLIASDSHLLLVVRDSFIEKVIERWNLKPYLVTNISEYNGLTITDMIMAQIK